MSIHLDLGCGPVPRNPYRRDKLCGVDIRADLAVDPSVEIVAANLSCEAIPYLHQDLLALMAARNRSGDATLVLPSEYLEVVIERA